MVGSGFNFPAARIRKASPANGEELVSPARTVVLRFDRRIDPGTLSSTNFYLIANGQRLPGRIEVSSTRRFATFFPSNAFPASTEIRIVVDGTNLRAEDGWRLVRAGVTTVEEVLSVTTAKEVSRTTVDEKDDGADVPSARRVPNKKPNKKSPEVTPGSTSMFVALRSFKTCKKVMKKLSTPSRSCWT